MDPIATVAIVAKPGIAQAERLIPELVTWLERRGIASRLDPVAAEYCQRGDAISREEAPDGAQLVIVLGGDGTLLSAARAVRGREIPILPVNLGGLGFLTAITVDELTTELEHVLAGQVRIGRRQMLRCEIVRGERTINSYDALNDAVITKGSLARMIDLDARVDGRFVCRYKADGLIVTTPTGSTAYSLSAGGPIIYPSVECLALTPICPHMLTNRPVIVPQSSLIDLLNFAADDDAWVTIDGQVGEPLKKGDHVLCRRSDFAVHLIRPPRLLFFDVLREKLKWGER